MDTFPNILSFENRSYECRRAIFGSASTDEMVPCLPIRVRLRSHTMQDVSNGLGIDASDLSSVTGYDCNWRDVSLDCSNAQVAAHLNGVIANALLRRPLPNEYQGGVFERIAVWTVTHVPSRGYHLLCLNTSEIRNLTWSVSDGVGCVDDPYRRDLSLPKLPELCHSLDPSTDPLFFGRVRVMVIEAMDEAKMFEKVSSAG